MRGRWSPWPLCLLLLVSAHLPCPASALGKDSGPLRSFWLTCGGASVFWHVMGQSETSSQPSFCSETQTGSLEQEITGLFLKKAKEE